MYSRVTRHFISHSHFHRTPHSILRFHFHFISISILHLLHFHWILPLFHDFIAISFHGYKYQELTHQLPCRAGAISAADNVFQSETSATDNSHTMQYPWPFPHWPSQLPPSTAPTVPVQPAQQHMFPMISHTPATLPHMPQHTWQHPPQPHIHPQMQFVPQHHPFPLSYTSPPTEHLPAHPQTMIPTPPPLQPPAPVPHAQPAPLPQPQPTPIHWDYAQSVWQPFSVFPPVAHQPPQTQPTQPSAIAALSPQDTAPTAPLASTTAAGTPGPQSPASTAPSAQAERPTSALPTQADHPATEHTSPVPLPLSTPAPSPNYCSTAASLTKTYQTSANSPTSNGTTPPTLTTSTNTSASPFPALSRRQPAASRHQLHAPPPPHQRWCTSTQVTPAHVVTSATFYNKADSSPAYSTLPTIPAFSPKPHALHTTHNMTTQNMHAFSTTHGT